MNIKYVSWLDLLNITAEKGVIYSIEIQPKLRLSANELIHIYLEDQSKALAEFEKFKLIINQISSEHNQVIDLDDAELNDLLVEVEWIIEEPVHDQPDYLEAQIKAYANLISARLGFLVSSSHCNVHWLDARDIIVTDENWTQASIVLEVSKSKFDKLDNKLSYISLHGVGASPDNQNTLTKHLKCWDTLA